MKKIVIALSLLLALPTMVFAAPLAWNANQRSIWAKMKSENHPMFQRLKNDQRGEEDFGIRDGLLYLITGDASYAKKAWSSQKWRTTKVLSGSNDRNLTRHQLETMALLYSWIYDALDDQGKKDFTTAMDNWVNFAIANTRASDSDELTGHYFGVALYALAVKDRNPDRYNQLVSAIGGFDATGENYSTWRNALKKFSKYAKGGQWIESSNYNLNTTRYLFIGVTAINEHFGVNKFPEFNFNEFAESHAAELTPNYKDSFQWGDNEEVRQLSKFRRVPTYSVLGGITKNPKILWALDKLLDSNFMQSVLYLYYDPYSPRQAIGDQNYDAPGMGVLSFKKEGRAFYSQMQARRFVDHEFNGFRNFNLFENGAWTITNTKGYYSSDYNEFRYLNDVRFWGMLPAKYQAVKKQTDFQFGSDWAYQAGIANGQSTNPSESKPKEDCPEMSSQIVYLDKEAIVTFDRANCADPKSFGDANFNLYRSELRGLYKPYHSWIIHLPDNMTVQNGDYVWKDNGRTIRLRALFEHDFTYEKFNGWGASQTSEDKHWLVLKKKNTQKFSTMMAVIDLTNSAVITKLGEGKVQINNTVIEFNANQNEAPSFKINRQASPQPTPDPVPPVPVPDPVPPCVVTSCNAAKPSCDGVSFGFDNCGGVCSLTGEACPPPCISNGSCNAQEPKCEEVTSGADNCGVPCIKQGAECPAVIQEVKVTMTEFKKKTSYYLGLVKQGNTKLIVTYYGASYEIRKAD